MLLASAALASPAGAEGPLAPARYAALDAVYSAFIPLEGAAPKAADYAGARTSCRALDSADPLLGPYRKACTANLKFVEQAQRFGDCPARASCLRAARGTKVATGALISRARAANGAIAAAMLPPACAGALRAKKSELALLERSRRFFALAERALRTRSVVLVARLQRDARTLKRLGDEQPSAARQRKTFRAACSPAASG